MENPHNIPHTKVPYFVPQGYFEHFPNTIAASIQSLSNPTDATLPAIALPYSLPDNFFENFTQNILLQVNEVALICNNQQISFGKIESPYSVPQGYFEQSANEITQRAIAHSAAEETELLSPMLASISKTMPYTAPAPLTVNEFVEKAVKPKSKVLEMSPWRSLKITKWASAASILLIFALGAYTLLLPAQNKSIDQEKSINALLAEIPQESIKEYVYNHLDEYENELDIYVTGNQMNDDIEFKNIIKEVPIDELRDYLEI